MAPTPTSLPDPTPEGYSTNPSTIKARRRKMTLNGARKHEEAARTADYKAMIYARKVVQDKPEYQNSPDNEKEAILKKAMRETMEKRRAKGQDTMSKMAAYNAGQSRRSTVGPMTRVPIADFLVSNGYVPPTAARSNQNQKQDQSLITAAGDPLNSGSANSNHLSNGGPSGGAPVADMNEHGTSGLLPLNNMEVAYQGPSSVPPQNDHHPNIGPTLRGYNLLVSTRSSNSSDETKPVRTPGPFVNMTPEPGMMHSIDGNGSEDGHVAALRNEVVQLRGMFQNIIANGNPMRDQDMYDVRAGLGTDGNRMNDLNQRVSQLEGMVHAIQNASLTTIDERVVALERVVDQLKEKVGDGCDAEVAKMREVFGSLREAMIRVGNFL